MPANGVHTWMRMANPSDTKTASFDVYFGGEYQKSFCLLPGQSDVYTKENFMGGSVKVVSKSVGGGPAVPIFASERTIISTTFNEVMGYPASQFSDTYLHLVRLHHPEHRHHRRQAIV